MQPLDVRADTAGAGGAGPAGAAEPIVVADAIWKSFGSLTAVRDLSFEARPGEIIGLLGPNGAGKTTAIRVLSTILLPTRGKFTLDGIPHTRPVEIRRRIGVLPESSGFPLHLTGGEFLRYHARLFGHPAGRAREVAAALLSEVGLAERASSPIATYSRGMRQRLGVARALVNDPKLIFLDEPTLGLDPAGQRQMLQLIRNLARQRGTTVILSTHFLDEVEQACPRVIILNRGRVVAQGTVAQMIRKAAAPRTGRFQVPSEMQETALTALKGARGVASAQSADGHDGSLMITLDEASLVTAQSGGAGMNGAITALMDAGVPILSFELEGSRLSDAFFSMTEEDQP